MRAARTASGLMSMATTLCAHSAAMRAATPVPVPRSRTRAPGGTRTALKLSPMNAPERRSFGSEPRSRAGREPPPGEDVKKLGGA